MKKGFTLIEVLIVIAIIGVLASIVYVRLDEGRNRSRYALVAAQMREIYNAASLDYDSNLSWAPDTFPGVAPRFVPTYLSVWPTPPCPNWTYDWDNWLGASDGSNIVRITTRNSAAGASQYNAIFYFCITSANASCDSALPTLGGGGFDFKNAPNKTITCNE